MTLLFQLYANGMKNMVILFQIYNPDSFIPCRFSIRYPTVAFPFHLNSVCFSSVYHFMMIWLIKFKISIKVGK